jgi:hypothetical protein
MTINEFIRLAQIWGGDIARWPDDARAEAEILAKSAHAQAILAEARALDRGIDSLAPEISPTRVDRAIYGVVNAIAMPTRPPTRSATWLRWLVPTTSLACAALIGVSLAVSHPVELVRRPADPGMIFTLLLDSASPEQD